MVVFLLSVGACRLWVDVINAEIRGGEAHVQEIAASGEMESARLRGVDVAQGHNFAHVVVRIEATGFQLEIVGLSPR